MSFGAQFLAGQRFAQGLVETYRDAQQRRDLDEIAKAKPVESSEFTPEQGQQIEAAAAGGKNHIGYDDKIKAYMATPKLAEGEMGPAQPVEIARQAPMTEFLGKKTPGTMTPDQVTNARQLAMADVISKSDPIQGMRLQREVKQGERDDQRWERENRKAIEEEDFQKGQQAEFGQTIYSKRIGDYATQMQAYEQYQAKLKSGAAPETLGAPPPMPQRPVYSVGESLADSGRLLAFKASKGKADPAEILQYAERLQKVSDEGYGKALKLAQGGAPLAKVIEQFNQTGSMKLDPAAIVSDEMVKDADGVPSRVIKVRDASGNVQTINALSELDAIGQAENYFGRFYRAEDNRRGNNADARAATQLEETIRHNRASEGIAGANLDIARQEAARKQQVFEQENKLPDPVKRSYAVLEAQAKSLDSAMYKAMAEGSWRPGAPGAEKLIADRTAVSLRMNKLLDPYMPAAKQGGAASAADPLGIRTPTPPSAAGKSDPKPVATTTVQQAVSPSARSPQSLGDDFASPMARHALTLRVQEAAAGGAPLTEVETLRARQLKLLTAATYNGGRPATMQSFFGSSASGADRPAQEPLAEPKQEARSPQSLGDDFASPMARHALTLRVQEAAAGGAPLTEVETLRARQLKLL